MRISQGLRGLSAVDNFLMFPITEVISYPSRVAYFSYFLNKKKIDRVQTIKKKLNKIYTLK